MTVMFLASQNFCAAGGKQIIVRRFGLTTEKMKVEGTSEFGGKPTRLASPFKAFRQTWEKVRGLHEEESPS